MNQPLLQIVVDLVSFLALSDNEQVDEDEAIEQLEHVVATLKLLPQRERDQLITFIAESADVAAKSKSHERSAFLRSLPDQLGLR